jgi:glycosyltransferase involved in cell wall biosynthesis
MRLALVYWTFPKKSETFLQREAAALVKLGTDVEFFSICGGGDHFDGKPIRRLGLGGTVLGFTKLLVAILTTRAIRELLVPSKKTSLANYIENLLGLAAGLVWKNRLAKFDWVHAQWGAAPAMVTLVARRLKGIHYSMGLHAYDLYEGGGDGWLDLKVSQARAVTSSSAQARGEVVRRFAPTESCLIRRGVFLEKHSINGPRNNEVPIFLTVGRVLPKKGFDRFIDLMAYLRDRSWKLDAWILGDGPFLMSALRRQISRLGLNGTVHMPGWTDNTEVMKWMSKSDFFLFTGRVSANGDRDGFPNVIAEAFARGAVVLAIDVAGVSEGVMDGKTGILLKTMDPLEWYKALESLQKDPLRKEALRKEAYSWVEENFDARKNALQLLTSMEKWSLEGVSSAKGNYTTVMQGK